MSFDNIIVFRDTKTYYSGNRIHTGFSTIAPKLKTYFSTFQNRICRENFESAENYESFQHRPVLGKIGGNFFLSNRCLLIYLHSTLYVIWKGFEWAQHLKLLDFPSQLASRVTFHEHLLPVCLPSPNRELEPGTTCTVIGWGKKDEYGSKYNVSVCL